MAEWVFLDLLVGDFLRIVPSCITIFNHHLEEYLDGTFSKHRRVANSSIAKELFLRGLMLVFPRKAGGSFQMFFCGCLFGLLDEYCPLLQWGETCEILKCSTSPSGKCLKWWVLFHPILGVILILGKGAWHSSQTPKQCENWSESLYALLETNSSSPLPMQFGRFPNFPLRGIRARKQQVKMLASNKLPDSLQKCCLPPQTWYLFRWAKIVSPGSFQEKNPRFAELQSTCIRNHCNILGKS